MQNKKYFIITYGCQMNIHESEKLAGIMQDLGYTVATDETDANVIIFNTCCIRENAEERAYGNIGALKKLKKSNPNLIIAVGGCMTQQEGKAQVLTKMFPFIDIVFGTHNLENFKDLLTKKLHTKKRVIEILEKELPVCEGVSKFRTSYPNAWVNIMYGCNNFCTYCIVPYVRGRERSRKVCDIVNECKELIAQGYKEITLLGQNVNSYGKDLTPATDFSSLIEEIAKLDGKFRLRFMTNHPKDFSQKLVDTMSRYDKIMKCIHLPVQAGSNRILSLMNRRYTREDYLEKLNYLKKVIPSCAVTTDIMVAFPTETEEDFLDTIDLVKQANFTGGFSFIYSPRQGTMAEKMDGQIDPIVAKDRIMRLIELQNKQVKEQSKAYKGKTIEVLCEGYDEKKNCYLGRDEYGRMAYFASNEDLIGNFVMVKIESTGGISLIGSVVKE